VIAMTTTAFGRWAGPAAVAGGLLWVPYGVLEMLEPGGADVVYRPELGYSLVVDAARFVAYSLPGALALLLTAVGLLGVFALLGPPAGRPGASGRVLAYVALALGVLSLAGVAALFDPVFTAGRVFGSLALGAATLLAGFGARRAGTSPGWTLGHVALGVMGLLLLPLWPLVYAVGPVSPAAGAAVIALFGLGWVALGYTLWSARALTRAAAPR
jgi:hypothetical protein